MRVYVSGIGLVGPGLSGWETSRRVLAGAEAYAPQLTVIPPASLLPAAERRRAGTPVKIALAAAQEAFAASASDPAVTATTFTSSGGDGDNVHQLCEVLAGEEREISPTRFHNSVHNAAAGYWSLATQSRAPSASLCAYDASFAAGLLEVAAQVSATDGAVALVAYDHPYPEPLHAKRRITDTFAIALVLSGARSESAIASIDVAFKPGAGHATRVADAGLEALRVGVPAARCLPLLVALARNAGAEIDLEYGERSHLTVHVTPCA